MTLQENLDWNPIAEKFTNSDKANSMLARSMRAPWDKVYEKYVI